MHWLGWTAAGLAAGPAALALYLRRQGDADIRFDRSAWTLLAASRSTGCWRVRFRLPAVNLGRQKGMLYEILLRPEYAGRWAADLRWSVAIFWPGVQETGYWAATLLKPGQVVPLEFEIAAYGPDPVLDRLLEREELVLVLRHGVIGRTPLCWRLTEVRIPLAETRAAAPVAHGAAARAGGSAAAAPADRRAGADRVAVNGHVAFDPGRSRPRVIIAGSGRAQATPVPGRERP